VTGIQFSVIEIQTILCVQRFILKVCLWSLILCVTKNVLVYVYMNSNLKQNTKPNKAHR